MSVLEEAYMAKGFMMRKSVVLACILSILVSAIVLVGCGGGGSSSQAPEQAAKAFFKAYEKKDTDTAWNMLSANTKNTTGSKGKAALESFLKKLSNTKFTVRKVTINGDKATAEVTVTASGNTSTETVPLVKENGAWKVDIAAMSNSSTK
jgi:Domain of unknown function (DUF4878)/Protein of unknown function (DUF2950)